MSWKMRPKLLEPELWKGHQDTDPACLTCWSPFTRWMMLHDPVEIEACIAGRLTNFGP